MDIEVMTKELTKFNVTDSAIAQYAEKYLPATIKDESDKVGLDFVHRGRIEIKSIRVSVEKTRKKLKEEALEWGRVVDGEAKRIVAMLQPIEDHLSDEESRITDAIAKRKAEAEAAITAMIQARANKLYDMGCRFDGIAYSYAGVAFAEHSKLRVATDEQFDELVMALQSVLDEEAAKKKEEEKQRLEEQALILKVQQEQEIERQRLEAIAKAQQEEADRLAREKEKAEALIREQHLEIERAKQKLIDEEAARQKAIDDEKARAEQEKIRAEELERIKAAAIEEGKRKAEEAAQAEKERLRLEAEAAAVKAEKARIAAEKREARRPEKVKIAEHVNRLCEMPTPFVESDEAQEVLRLIAVHLSKMAAEVRVRLEEM